jgi:hypothetical protein
MSFLPLVQAGTTTAQAAIDAVEQFGADPDTLGLRLSVMRLLFLQQEDMTATGDDEELLAAYRDWLNVATRSYGPEPGAATDREYSRSAAILLAELRLAGSAVSADAGSGNGAASNTVRVA